MHGIKIRGSKKQGGIPVCAYAFQSVPALVHIQLSLLTTGLAALQQLQVENKIQPQEVAPPASMMAYSLITIIHPYCLSFVAVLLL